MRRSPRESDSPRSPKNVKFRPMVALTEQLLEQISSSLKVFKPSKSLSMLNKLTEDYEKEAAAEIDLVISGGGMKCYFMTGCYAILCQELKKRNVKIARIAGASAGAWSGFFMCTGKCTTILLQQVCT
jgi:predicted acylesterase/phospholipase RssA